MPDAELTLPLGAVSPSGDKRRRARRRRRLQAWLPETMTGMVALGCLLAASPLLAAIIIGSLVMQQQAQRSEALVSEALRLERLGAQLGNELRNLERGGLQYLALSDDNLLPLIERRRSVVEETLHRLASEDLPQPMRQQIATVAATLDEVETLWVPSAADSASLVSAMDKIHALPPVVDGIVAAGRSAIDERVQALRDQTRQARHLTAGLAFLLVPLSALLSFVFSRLVTRPLGRLRKAIVMIGISQNTQPVRIDYPREMSRVGDKLDWLRRRLATLEAEKDRFLCHVSHELKTPLASLREGTELLADGTLGPLNAQQTEVAQILAESSEELGTQIGNLLAYAEWRIGQRRVEMSWFEVKPLIQEVQAKHRLPLGKRGVQVVLQTDEHQALFGHRARLRVALDNLLGNAIKHAPPGSVIEITAARDSERCLLSVRDYGRGIPEHERERILEPFVRGSEAEEIDSRGTGVGLSIVVETMNAHEGTLEIQDAAPGARLVMRWPCPSPGI